MELSDSNFCFRGIKAQIEPQINNESKEKLKMIGQSRFTLCTTDIDYLIKNIKSLDVYNQAKINMPLLVGIYDSPIKCDYNRNVINKLSERYDKSKIFFFYFYSQTFDEILSDITENDYKKDLTINYIRNARFNLVYKVWSVLGLENYDSSIKEIATYVTDLDIFVMGNYDELITNKYGSSKTLLSWSSLKTKSHFPDNLTASRIDPIKKNGKKYYEVTTAFSHKTIKCGFSCFSPSPLTLLILEAHKSYAYDLQEKGLHRRLFSFYYGDQISLLLSVLDIKQIMPKEYVKYISWLDVNESKIVNIDYKKKPLLIYPKGNTRVGLKELFPH